MEGIKLRTHNFGPIHKLWVFFFAHFLGFFLFAHPVYPPFSSLSSRWKFPSADQEEVPDSQLGRLDSVGVRNGVGARVRREIENRDAVRSSGCR